MQKIEGKQSFPSKNGYRKKQSLYREWKQASWHGEEDGPIEDIGGLDQYYEFKEIYDNASHPEHEKAKALAQKKDYYGYDFSHINHVLKMRKYGK